MSPSVRRPFVRGVEKSLGPLGRTSVKMFFERRFLSMRAFHGVGKSFSDDEGEEDDKECEG